MTNLQSFDQAQDKSKISNLQSKTILLVEDNPDDVLIAQHAFRKASLPHHLQVVEDGQAAIDYLSGTGEYADRERYPLPGLMLLDLRLPKRTGFEVLTWLRDQPELRSLPVAVLTASKESPDITQAYQLGANTYLIKPVSPEALQQAVQSLILPLEQPPRLLVIDDNPDDRAIILRLLRREFPGVQVQEIDDPQGFEQAMEAGDFDLVLSDFNMPWTTGLEKLHIVKSRYPECPMVIVTGTATEENLLEALQAGVDDYVLKSPRELLRLPTAVRSALGRAWQRQALRESEARFRRLAENAQDIIYRIRLTPTRGIEYVSPAATAVLGYTPEEHYADPDLGFKLVHPDDRLQLEKYFQGKGVFGQPLTLRLVRKDGTVIWVEQRNVPIYDEAGNLVAIEGIARDITARKQTEAALRESEETARTLTGANPESVFLLDIQGTVLAVNEVAAQRLGRSVNELIGANIYNILPPAVAEVRKQRLAEVIQTGKPTHWEDQRGDRYFDNRVHPILDVQGQVARLAILAIDITERKQAEEALREVEVMRRLSVSRTLVGQMFRDLQNLGGLSEGDMFRAGQELAARVAAESLPKFLEAFADMGLGTLNLHEADEERRRSTFTGDGLVERRTESGQPTCSYARGFLCGAVAHVLGGKRVAGVEMACQSMGDELCRFVVQVVGE